LVVRFRSRLLLCIVGLGSVPCQAATNADWLLPSSGTWTTAANWSTNPVIPNNGQPLATDTYVANIAATGGSYTVSLASPITIDQLDLNSASATFSHTAGTFTVINAINVQAGTYVMSGGTLNGAGNLIVSSTFDWSSGTIAGSGLLMINPTAAMNIGSLSIGYRLSRVLNNFGTINMDATGTLIGGTLNNSGYLNITNSGTSMYSPIGTTQVTNSGTIVATGATISFGSVAMNNSGTIVANNGTVILSNVTHGAGAHLVGAGTIVIGFPTTISGTTTFAASTTRLNQSLGGAGNVVIAGGFDWTNGTFSGTGHAFINPGGTMNINTGTHVLSRVLHNSGAINIGSGTHSLTTTLNNSGTINMNDQVLRFNGGTLNNSGYFSLSTGLVGGHLPFSSVVGTTNVLNNTGTMACAGTLTLANVPIRNAGTILINNNNTLTLGSSTHETGSYLGGVGTILLSTSSGSINLTGTTTFAAKSVRLNGGSIQGTGDLVVANVFDWHNGTITGSGQIFVNAGATLNFGTAAHTLSRVLNNAGTIGLEPGQTITFANGTINNTGYIRISPFFTNTPFINGSGANRVNNAGTIVTSNGTNALGSVPVFNSGTILASNFTLELRNVTFENGSWLGGGGTVFLNPDGTTTQSITGTTTFAADTVQLTGGTLNGPGNLIVASTFNWRGGTFTGSGEVLVSPGASVFLDQPGARTLSRVFNNAGSLSLSNGGSIMLADGTINNSGFLRLTGVTFASRTPLTNGPGANLLNNTGTIEAIGSITIAVPFNNTGTVMVGSPPPGPEAGTASLGFSVAPNQVVGNTLTGGSWVVGDGGNLFLPSDITTNQGRVVLSATCVFPQIDTLLDNQGTFELRGGRYFTPTGPFINSGAIAIDPTSFLILYDTFDNSGSISGNVANNSVYTLSGSHAAAGKVNNAVVASLIVAETAQAAATYVRGGTLDIRAGATLAVTSGGGSLGTSRVPHLAIADGGTLDLGDHALIVDYTGVSPLATIRSQLTSGRAGGLWNGTGITSSAAALDPAHTGLGYAEASTIPGAGGGTYSGQAVDSTAVIVAFTYLGDTDLDGDVDVADLGAMATNWQATGDWINGDFDYSGAIEVNDLGLLATNWQAGVTASTPTFARAIDGLGLPDVAVPEPALEGLLLAAAPFVRGRAIRRARRA
jgi:hypothetical protein